MREFLRIKNKKNSHSNKNIDASNNSILVEKILLYRLFN